jgi:hypothetical protein
MDNLLITILTSSFVGSLVTVVFTKMFDHYTQIKSKHIDFLNSYHKLIIERRVEAYEQLEVFLINFKVAVLDDDKKLYHLLFLDTNEVSRTHEIFLKLVPFSMWFSTEAFDKTREFNFLLNNAASAIDRVSFAKEKYSYVADLRESLESIIATDLIGLYDVESFLLKRSIRKPDFQKI